MWHVRRRYSFIAAGVLSNAGHDNRADGATRGPLIMPMRDWQKPNSLLNCRSIKDQDHSRCRAKPRIGARTAREVEDEARSEVNKVKARFNARFIRDCTSCTPGRPYGRGAFAFLCMCGLTATPLPESGRGDLIALCPLQRGR
jgi:hypothetical protein